MSGAREAFKAAMVAAAANQGGAGAQFIANGHSNLWLDIAYEAAEALTTPSQELDAATVERCAQIAEANAATSVPLMNGLGVAACIEQGRHRAGTEIAKQIRALATEPHQHGGKGA